MSCAESGGGSAVKSMIKLTPEIRKKFFSKSTNLKSKVLYRKKTDKYAEKRKIMEKKPKKKRLKNIRWV